MVPPNPENEFENGAKFLCLKVKGRTISLFLHQTAMATKSLKTVIFQPPPMIVSQFHVMPKVPKQSECGTENFFARMSAHFVHPLFQILDPPL